MFIQPTRNNLLAFGFYRWCWTVSSIALFSAEARAVSSMSLPSLTQTFLSVQDSYPGVTCADGQLLAEDLALGTVSAANGEIPGFYP